MHMNGLSSVAVAVPIIGQVWVQTYWSRVLCAVLAVALVLGIYRLCIMRVGQAMKARFDERLAERTRLARELHDTFLQTIQGCIMVTAVSLEGPNDPIQMRRTLEQLSEWLQQAAQEGRAAVHAMRASVIETNNLACAFKRALEDCQRETSMETTLSVRGEVREMHPVVRDEVYRLGYEAIRNACSHSAGSRVEVFVNYGNNLNMEVRDNGVGIDPAIVEAGKAGHFGLQGMRERATRIGARLTISSSANSGTRVELLVPGSIMFCAAPNATKFRKIRRLFLHGDRD